MPSRPRPKTDDSSKDQYHTRQYDSQPATNRDSSYHRGPRRTNTSPPPYNNRTHGDESRYGRPTESTNGPRDYRTHVVAPRFDMPPPRASSRTRPKRRDERLNLSSSAHRGPQRTTTSPPPYNSGAGGDESRYGSPYQPQPWRNTAPGTPETQVRRTNVTQYRVKGDGSLERLSRYQVVDPPDCHDEREPREAPRNVTRRYYTIGEDGRSREIQEPMRGQGRR